MSFSFKDRKTSIASLSSRPPEVLIIGGGVVGCSVAAHVAEWGLDCVLVEREDIASGASGNSTGLAHAGLRYLAQGRVLYVLHESRERQLLQELAPHWVRPFNFLFPVYRGDPFGLFWVRVGTWLYDRLGWFYSQWLGSKPGLRYRVLPPQAVLERVPGLQTKGLEGATEYFVDARLPDSRFTLGFAQKAAIYGARIITYAEVESFILRPPSPPPSPENTITPSPLVGEGGDGGHPPPKSSPTRGEEINLNRGEGGLAGVVCRDRLTGERFVIKARLIVNAAGPWIDGIRHQAGFPVSILQNSKGIHLIIDRVAETPLILSTRVRGKVFFVIPVGRDVSLIGTTDTPLEGSPDDAKPDERDVSELITELFRFFPGLVSPGDSSAQAIEAYKKSHVREVYWGIRPLIRQKGSTVEASREHALIKDSQEFWSVPGVKLTAGRAAGAQVAVEAWKQIRGTLLPCVQRAPLPGGEFSEYEAYVQEVCQQPASQEGSPELLRYLVSMYGTRYQAVLEWARRDPRYRDRIVPEEPWLYAEIPYAVEEEMVLTLNDFLWRRARWPRLRSLPESSLRQIAIILGEQLGWYSQEVDEQIESFKKELDTHRCQR